MPLNERIKATSNRPGENAKSISRGGGRGDGSAIIRGLRKSTLALLALVLPSCGGGSGPTPLPSSTPPPGRVPGGELTGAYTLQIVPAAACGLGIPTLTFNMDAAATTATTRAGVQVLHATGDFSSLELEFLREADTVRGGFATRHDGARSLEEIQVWVHAVGVSEVTHVGTGRGEAITGQLLGYVALGNPSFPEGSLGACSTTEHRFTLRTR
jgi:hypothetical protein